MKEKRKIKMTTKKDYEKMKEEMLYYQRKSEEYLKEIIRLNKKKRK